jgi:exonuclease SbcC
MMSRLQARFNDEFQRWFALLVEDSTKTARIDEDFTPIIEQDGYEQSIDYLSGGEKTSVALSYRLALNTIFRELEDIDQSNLLIFDEPTDGFSKNQLFKFRNILGELNCPQVIIVSHEQELESFANKIVKIQKTNNNSIIIP